MREGGVRRGSRAAGLELVQPGLHISAVVHHTAHHPVEGRPLAGPAPAFDGHGRKAELSSEFGAGDSSLVSHECARQVIGDVRRLLRFRHLRNRFRDNRRSFVTRGLRVDRWSRLASPLSAPAPAPGRLWPCTHRCSSASACPCEAGGSVRSRHCTGFPGSARSARGRRLSSTAVAPCASPAASPIFARLAAGLATLRA